MKKQEMNSIDLLQVAKFLWRYAWVIAIGGLIAAVIGFSIAAFAIDPTYSSYVKLYVNNSSISVGNASFSISSSQLSAAQSLLKTYGDILVSRSTLERIIDEADVDYTWKQLSEMITYASSNNTEIMRVTVTCKDPYEASKIANTIADVLPDRISEIIDGASMEIVDSAIPDLEKIAPSVTGYTARGLIIGVFLSAAVLCCISIMDDTIHDEEYVLRTYDYPILGKVPDLLNAGNKSYGYYSRKHQRANN